MNRFSERDWKLFRSKIAGWQGAYMDKLNKEYMAILCGDGNASEKFWKLEKRIKEDNKDCGVQCEMSRSNQFCIMLELLNDPEQGKRIIHPNAITENMANNFLVCFE